MIKLIMLMCWLTFYPLSMTLDAYFSAKRKKITGEELTKPDFELVAYIFIIIIITILCQ